MWRRRALLVLGMVCLVAADQNIELCNSNTNGPAIPAYTNYIRFLYQHGLSVLPITMPGNCDQYDVADLLVDGLVDTIPFVDALGGANFDINQQHAYCNAVAQNILHAQAGTDLTVKWLTAWPVTYTQPFNPAPTYMTQVFTLMTDPTYTHNFVAKTYKTTVWTSVYLQPPSAYDEGTVPLVYEVSADFYNQAMTFSQQGFSGFETYIQFAPSVQSRLVQVQAPGNGKMLWGISTLGCSPPTFTLSVNWQTIVALSCSQPYILVTSITEDSSFQCSTPFSTNQLRMLGSSTLASQYLVKQTYTATALGKILISAYHAQNIVNCIFPSNTLLFAKWAQYSASAPGACTPCVQQQLMITGSTPIAVACNLSAGQTSDCCYICRQGYNSLDYTLPSGGAQVQQCVKACSPGSYYDNPAAPRPNCIHCDPGKFTLDSMTCRTCMQLGMQNAYADPSAGCVACGARALATGGSAASCPFCYTACTPCQGQLYVPPGGSICQPCQNGSVLRSITSTGCTPCPAGFFVLSGRCAQCPTNTYKPSPGAGLCQPCASGLQSAPDRTQCVPCTDINTSTAPYAIYTPHVSGCSAVCDPRVSFAKGSNPYAADGCAPCTLLTVPNGLYTTAADCSTFLHCLNVPAPNSTKLLLYTGSGNQQGICPWQCVPGYSQPGPGAPLCVPCNAKGFNQSLHVYISGCTYACMPALFYRQVACAPSRCCS